MKVAFVSQHKSRDIRNWSGTLYYMSQALMDAGFDLEFIDEMKNVHYGLLFKLKDLFFNRLLRGRLGKYSWFYEPGNLKFLASQVKRKIDQTKPDVIFAPGAIPIAYLETDKPVLLWADATFEVMHNYYPEFSNFSFDTLRHCRMYEKNAITRSDLCIFSSQWAATSAIEDYGAQPGKVKVVPYGANIECNRTLETIHQINKYKSREVCRLLFIGQDWVRKGGDSAVRITNELNRRNIRTELTMVGCKAPENWVETETIKILGFVDKSKREGLDLINKMYCESHFFILPTVADCTPIVFSEANSYGLPVISSITGGIQSIVTDDRNGKLFSLPFDTGQVADYISSYFSDEQKYATLSIQSFNEFQTNLNWETSISKIAAFINQYQ